MAAARTKGRNAAIGVLATALLASGLLMGVSYGDTGRASIAVPTEIQVFIGDGNGLRSHEYSLRDEDGKASGGLGAYRDPALDADGDPMGNVKVTCISSKSVLAQCTGVATLKAGPYSEAGSITFAGNFRGFTGETQAVTGGTGAYDNVRGTVTNTVIDDQLVRVFNLLP